MTDGLGVLEINGLTHSILALDAMDKAADVRVLQAESNDFYGVCIKVLGSPSALQSAIEAGRALVQRLGGRCVATIINAPDEEAWRAIQSPREVSPLLEAPLVFFPTIPQGTEKELPVADARPFAIGLIETQGFTAVFEAIDTACKAANVEVIGKEKLGGGYITVLIKGDVAAVEAAIEAGKTRVEGLGKLIAAHVIARPSEAVLSLLPGAK